MVLKGNVPVIPTPFLNGKLHLSDFDNLLSKTIDHLDGYVVCGSTGEAPALSKEERIAVVDYLAKKMPKDKHIVVGLGDTNLNQAVEIGLRAADAGVRTALIPSPYYFPNSLNMVIEYIGKIAELTGLDIAFYDNPVTTNTRFTANDLIQLADAVPNVKYIKMTDHSFSKIRTLKEKTNLTVFGGDDIICYRAFEAGVDGSMIITPSVFPAEFRECWEAYQSGDREKSFDIYTKVLLPFIIMFGPGDEIPTTKALFHHLGIFSSSETRLPLLKADEQRFKEVMLGYKKGLSGSTLQV
ncbi:dihydrodipicolinate synthase family protein [Lederbergia panacisoli]|uniref:dihydrodipicolinate synthase family protein n=1 Tax=Lederbergia panacisoli TaxID=1255251 RepID=UPI00214D0740|nr:dihydrodipicolinate synthase family protein [Lederbergia panacisoli]MCR2821719.1 dihydrodipicolinate synthase family protein [Lederbergia panacisoli]